MEQEVKVCDATEDEQRDEAGNKKILSIKF
jgi:hypothetical protein